MTNNSLKAQSEPGNTNASLGDLDDLMDDSAPKPASISEGTIPFDEKSKPIEGQMLLIGAGVLNPESENSASTQTNLSVEDELPTRQSTLANPTPFLLKDEPSGMEFLTRNTK
ncbi:hypothetical protein HDV04_004040 [Boothiomyces sp. JEL0838]|nr:hypothetical protein HDV04_004040 [Boothiomyces sp. JEL0838]